MTESRVHQETTLRLSAASTEFRTALQQEADALRASLEQRLVALTSMAARQEELFQRLAQDVSGIAIEDAEAAAASARQQAESAGQENLRVAQTQAQTDIKALQAELQMKLQVERSAFEAQLTQALTAHDQAASALAEAQAAIAMTVRERDEQVASLEEARRRIHNLEEDHAQLALVQQVAEAHLEEEVQRRTMIAKQLDAAREEIQLAKAEADSCRLEAHLALERVRALETRQAQLEAAAAQARMVPPPEPAPDGYAALDRVKKGLDALSSTAKPEEMLTILVEQLSRDFATVAVFVAGSQGFRLLKSRSGDSGADIRSQVVALTGDSLLARASKDRTSVTMDAGAGDGVMGLCDKPLGHAIALPVQANGHVIAVAYAENPPGDANHPGSLGDKIAEILVDRVNQRLKRTPPAAERPVAQQAEVPAVTGAEVSQYALTRQARRVKINAEIEVLVDGVASVLIDLSTLGAQVVSPTTLRPNRPVRIMLPRDEGAVACKGRIVWAQMEPPRANKPALYRAGVHFAETDAPAIESFVNQHGQLLVPTGAITH